MVTVILLISLPLGYSLADKEVPAVTVPLSAYEQLYSEAKHSTSDAEHAERLRTLEASFEQRRKELNKEHTRLLQEARSVSVGARAQQALETLFPEGYQLLDHAVNGSFNVTASQDDASADIAAFEIRTTLRVLSDEWTVVAIANASSVVASGFQLDWRPDTRREGCQAEPLVVSEPLVVCEPSGWANLDPLTDPRALLLLRDGRYELATNRSGQYRIGFVAHSRVRKARTLKEVGLSTHVPVSEVWFRLIGAGAVNEVSVEPPAAVVTLHPGGSADDATFQLITPPTTAFQIKWLDSHDGRARRPKQAASGPLPEAGSAPSAANASQPARKKAEPKEAEPLPQVAVTHDALVSISEGLVQTTHVLAYKGSGDTQTLAFAEVIVHDNQTRIISVFAPGLLSWHAEYNATATGATILRAAFKSTHLELPHLTVSTEQELDMRRAEFAAPVIECVGALRQTGHVGIATVGTVLVETKRAFGLGPVDASAIASQLRLNTDRPIVMAYKYLSLRHELRVGVQQHAVADVLEAVVDHLHYSATVIDEYVHHSVEVVMQHTKQQHLPLQGLPASAHMFSLTVDGEPAKPVQGGSQGLLVPLLGSSRQAGENDGTRHELRLALTYLSKTAKWEAEAGGGNATLSVPQLELPISVLTAQLMLPEWWDYNFSGGFGEDVVELDFPPPSGARSNLDADQQEGARAREARAAREMEEHGKKSAAPGATSRRARVKQQQKRMRAPANAGVSVRLPDSGKRYFFQRLLVVGTQLEIGVAYAPPPPPPPPSAHRLGFPFCTLWSK